jgi:4-hydroxy-2-oxoheptanedioate aldolase
VAAIKDLLREGKTVRLFGMGQLAHHKLVEMVAFMGGYDAIWIDQEHAGVGLREIECLTLACRAQGLDSIVRLEPTDYARVMRPLEAGAGGIMAAQIRSVQQARDVVRWCRFWPVGNRGINGGGVDGRYGLMPLAEYAEEANRRVLVALQIETIDAVECLPELARLDEVDLLFVGPSDLAHAMGLIGQFEHPRCMDTIEYIARVCREAGKPWGIVATQPAYARHWLERGCRVFMLGTDLLAFKHGLETLKATFYPTLGLSQHS